MSYRDPRDAPPASFVAMFGHLEEDKHVRGCPIRAGSHDHPCGCNRILDERRAIAWAPIVCANGLCASGCTHGPPNAAQVVLCRAWLRRWTRPSRSLSPRTSYRLKHDVERATAHPGVSYGQKDRQGRVSTSERLYVSNGAFIRAALLEGYRIHACSAGSPNAFLYLALRKAPSSLAEVSA